MRANNGSSAQQSVSMSDEPGFRPETHSTYEPTAEEVAARARRPVDDALDVLRRGCYLGGDLPGVDEVEGALATVRSELERLREERDSWVETYLDRGRDLAAAEAESAQLRQALERVREMLYDATITYSTFCDKCGPMDDADPSDPKYLGTPMMTETLPLREVVEAALRAAAHHPDCDHGFDSRLDCNCGATEASRRSGATEGDA